MDAKAEQMLSGPRWVQSYNTKERNNKMNENNETIQTQRPGRFRPSLALYHPTPTGTGCAMKMNLHPAHDDVSGSIMLTLANQMTIGNRNGPNPTYATFDWDNALTVKLDFEDLSRMLQVFRGECESVGDGKGLYHATAQFSTSIYLRHIVEPASMYSIELFRTSRDGKSESHARFLMRPNEALGISLAIEDSFGVIAFGIPMLVQHDTSQYRRESKEFRNAAAA